MDDGDEESPPSAKRPRVDQQQRQQEQDWKELISTVAKSIGPARIDGLQREFEEKDQQPWEDAAGEISGGDFALCLERFGVDLPISNCLLDCLSLTIDQTIDHRKFWRILHKEVVKQTEEEASLKIGARIFGEDTDEEEDGQMEDEDDSRLPGPQPAKDAIPGQADGPQRAVSSYRKENLPEPREHEIEFLVKDPKSYAQGKSIVSHSRTLHGSFSFRLLVFPMGTSSSVPPQLASFVEALPPDSCGDSKWAFESVKYMITVVNWKDYQKSVTQQDSFTFSRDSADRGWHKGFVKASNMTEESGWLNEKGELCLRASCSSRRAMLQHSSRKTAGFVGLKNHGATCYMNCLLQTLFCLGHFRHIAYCIAPPQPEESKPGVSSDATDSLSLEDDQPAQPLLVSLQNLFYRLQTSEVPVSCKELMRSFGWDTADAFMQHDAQELNRLLCDRLEEQMKGSAEDGEIKRLFEGEFENYIECVDVDYRSERKETFYDLQLNLRNEASKDIKSLEESLRDFTSEEMLEGDNAYDAGSEHGKQRARKGIRFKRFPPVLYIQLKRFCFDPQQMDMNKLNGKMEFPRILDLEDFAKGSGKYMLHTVIVHSGGVSSGHYYAFVRVSGEDDQWIKFDDETVTFCCEEAAVEDNYGGEDLQPWNYFNLSPKELRQKEPNSYPRIHNAYMLSYVRIDMAKELLAPPILDGKEEKYRALMERCAREERLAEERRKARYELLMRAEVKVVLERDIMKMKGFWSNTDEINSEHTLRMSRDDRGEDICREVQKLLQVPDAHFTIFLLAIRRTRQVRFKHLPPNEILKNQMPQHGSPHSAQDSHLIVLVVLSQGYDPHTLKYVAGEHVDGSLPHDISLWTDELVLLIIKYFCPSKQVMVTLGCWYSHQQETLKTIFREPEFWFAERLKAVVMSGEVAPLSQPVADTEWECWEEYNRTPKDIQLRDISKTIKDEGLFCGDILVWQPISNRVLPARPPADGAPGNGGAADEDDDPLCLTVRDYAEMSVNRFQLLVRHFSNQAPHCPDGVPAIPFGQPLPPALVSAAEETDTSAQGLALGEVCHKDIVVDLRWSLPVFARRVAKEFGLSQAIAEGGDLWLYSTGAAPSALLEPPFFRTSKVSSVEGSDPDLADMIRHGDPNRRRAVSVVTLPSCPEGKSLVVVHFFDSSVCEVGACILHATSILAPEEEDSPDAGQANFRTSRPEISPAEVLELSRQYLEAPGEDRQLLRQKLLAGRKEDSLPPLRLLDVSGGRIKGVHRSRQSSAVDAEGQTLWQAESHLRRNIFFHALRVELDVDFEEEAEQSQSQLVEVFHYEQDVAEVFSSMPFGHPFLLRVSDGDLCKDIVAAAQAKLNASAKDLRQTQSKFLLALETKLDLKTLELHEEQEWTIREDEDREWKASNRALCIQRIHPMYQGRTAVPPQRPLHVHKPLTIKA